MQLVLVTLACFAGAPAALAQPTPALVRSVEDFAALQAEWERTIAEWDRTTAEAKAAGVKRRDRAPHPAPSFWPRFAAAAEGGEGAAVEWMALHLRDAWPKRKARAEQANALLALFERTPSAPWVPAALPDLAEHRRDLDPARYGALLEQLAAAESPRDLRVAALLARADLVEKGDDAAASALRLQALELRLGNGDGERTREQLDELASALLAEYDEARNRYFEAVFEAGEDGSYRQRPDAPPDPESTYRPLIASLADAGSMEARVWVLANIYAHDEATKEKLGKYLEELAREGLPADSVRTFSYSLGRLVPGLGADVVEPRVRELAANSPEESRLPLLAQLGEALCDTADGDEAQRERGVALLREVIAAAPDSEDAKRAAGKLFRYTELVVGKTAPDFETTDVDGNAFKLSDYTGKVVVIDFWGFW